MFTLAAQTGSRRPLLIPDTNAVYLTPALETHWRCLDDEASEYDVAILAEVIRELDQHKGGHRPGAMK